MGGGWAAALGVGREARMGRRLLAEARAAAMIDEYPVLAVTAAFATGETVMRGIGELRVKESDRIALMSRGLEACGVDLEEEPEGFIVRGTGVPPRGGADIETAGDHRVAMSHLVLGLAAGGTAHILDVNPPVEGLGARLHYHQLDVTDRPAVMRLAEELPGEVDGLQALFDHFAQTSPDVEIINISGDIHISNAFTAQPDGFAKPIFQVTSSPLTNRVSTPDSVSNLLSIGGALSFLETRSDLGEIKRLWHEGVYQNFLSIDASEQRIEFRLNVYNRGDEAGFGARDRRLVIRAGGGFEVI